MNEKFTVGSSKIEEMHKKVSGTALSITKNNPLTVVADKADKAGNVEWGLYGAVAVGVVIGAAGILDMYNDYKEKNEEKKQVKTQEKNLRRKKEKLYEDRYLGYGAPAPLPSQVGLMEDLFNDRIGHTNSWGGNRY